MGAGAGGEGEFAEDLLDVDLDGALGNEQAVGDGPVGQPNCEEREHLAFLSGELVEKLLDHLGFDAQIARKASPLPSRRASAGQPSSGRTRE